MLGYIILGILCVVCAGGWLVRHMIQDFRNFFGG